MKETYNLLQTDEIFLKLIYLKLLQEYWTYEWDLWNRLIEVKQYNAPDNGECVEVSYEYDALNHRILRKTDTETTKYAYGRNGALAYQEKTVDGSVTKRSFTQGTIFNGTTTSGQVGNLFIGTMTNFNVNQPQWAGSVGVVGENIIPTMIDIKNNLEGN